MPETIKWWCLGKGLFNYFCINDPNFKNATFRSSRGRRIRSRDIATAINGHSTSCSARRTVVPACKKAWLWPHFIELSYFCGGTASLKVQQPLLKLLGNILIHWQKIWKCERQYILITSFNNNAISIIHSSFNLCVLFL